MRGMPNMQGMMKQVKQMQKEMTQAQDELNATTFTGKAADDAVIVEFNGSKEMQDIKIKPEAVDPDDVDMLQDLIIMAVNDAMKQIDTETESKMGKFNKNLPF